MNGRGPLRYFAALLFIFAVYFAGCSTPEGNGRREECSYPFEPIPLAPDRVRVWGRILLVNSENHVVGAVADIKLNARYYPCDPSERDDCESPYTRTIGYHSKPSDDDGYYYVEFLIREISEGGKIALVGSRELSTECSIHVSKDLPVERLMEEIVVEVNIKAYRDCSDLG
ncbi:hypothetical protein K8I61_14485 [bacterium]|nr:hypothetical protein [bacterium]